MLIAIILSLVFLGSTFGLQLKLRHLRKKRVQEIELRPNCLLTRFPILFVAGPRSLFRLFEPWNEIPVFLREHGYEVFIFEPNFASSATRRKSVAEQVRESLKSLAENLKNETSPGKFHVIAESACEANLQTLAEEASPHIASLTLAMAPPVVHSESSLAARIPLRPRVLKPLAITIGELHLSSHRLSASGFWNQVALRLLTLHNCLARLRKQTKSPTHALAVGQILTRDWQIETHFLKRAIELAEQDAQSCGN